MRYLGGKSRTYKEICAFLESIRLPDQTFVEPFCGACWITQGMSGKRVASDANAALITMWKAAISGFQFPDTISKAQHTAYKRAQPANDPLTAFIGSGYSFGGDWFCGYCTHENKASHLGNPKRTVGAKAARLGSVAFSARSFSEWAPTESLVYCDPPYAATTGYGAVGSFDSAEFWATMRIWSETNTVVVSEYAAPEDFVCVNEIRTKTDMHTKTGQEARVEKLFMHESQAGLALI